MSISVLSLFLCEVISGKTCYADGIEKNFQGMDRWISLCGEPSGLGLPKHATCPGGGPERTFARCRRSGSVACRVGSVDAGRGQGSGQKMEAHTSISPIFARAAQVSRAFARHDYPSGSGFFCERRIYWRAQLAPERGPKRDRIATDGKKTAPWNHF